MSVSPPPCFLSFLFCLLDVLVGNLFPPSLGYSLLIGPWLGEAGFIGSGAVFFSRKLGPVVSFAKSQSTYGCICTALVNV